MCRRLANLIQGTAVFWRSNARQMVFLVLIAIFLPTALAGEAHDDWRINCMIRKDKFRYVLPQAMRNNDIDMWIVIDKGRGTEPLFRDFGIATSNGNGLFVFTDRGGPLPNPNSTSDISGPLTTEIRSSLRRDDLCQSHSKSISSTVSR